MILHWHKMRRWGLSVWLGVCPRAVQRRCWLQWVVGVAGALVPLVLADCDAAEAGLAMVLGGAAHEQLMSWPPSRRGQLTDKDRDVGRRLACNGWVVSVVLFGCGRNATRMTSCRCTPAVVR